ncbi:MAG: dihydroorotate dehydrogenase [Synergistaceae bacterium]|nr:dihydroorotate dehydrogenase [Synergistaceae bacterium]
MSAVNLEVKIGGLSLRNPVMNASGTFGTYEYAEHIDFSRIGAVVPKSVTLNPRAGNATPRITEVFGGVINAVGIQNTGIHDFVENKLPEMRGIKAPLIVSVSNTAVKDFETSVRLLEDAEGISAYEINISCPNLEKDGCAFGFSEADTAAVVRTVRGAMSTNRPVIVKLSPNVTDIVQIARAAADSGADALTIANTYLGMVVDLNTRGAVLGNKIGGVSGAAIKPLTMRRVYSVCKALTIPVIASGGICSARDALEYLMVGARAVQVGTANFTNPAIMEDIVSGIEKWLVDNGISDVNDFIGTIRD